MLGRNATYFHHPRPSSSSSAIDVDGGGVEFLLHHHQYLQHHHHPEPSFPGLYLASNPPPLESPTFFNQENGELPSMAAKKPAKTKKDRHSKIHTAQGPRDRRVRLSIGIARKFFDLQETLGFDKPSKTLDWLLTKSKTAIKELVQKKQCSSSSPPSACELHGDDAENGGGGEPKRKLNGDKAAAASNLAKESRAKARARARERTLEKMCFKQLGSDLNPPFQCRNNQLEFLQLSASTNNVNNVSIYHDSLRNEDLIQESSAVIKRKNKNPSSSSSSSMFHQNHLVFPTDLNSNYINIPSANENWDFFGLNSHSNLHAAFDQHKFFNSNSNI